MKAISTPTIGDLFARLPSRWRAHAFKAMRLYPPYFGAKVRVDYVSPERRVFEVSMRLTATNRNFVGTHFGGSLYSMCDPFYMLILMENLGPEFVVWDKVAKIRFLSPGRGTVRARFEITEEEIRRIHRAAGSQAKVEPEFETTITDARGRPVARVEKTLHVRRKGRL